MKLYYTKGACSLACRIVINDLGLDCDFIAVDLKKKTTEQGEDFKKINPKGAVPTLETDDGKVLTENAVILQYLADKSKATALLPLIGDFKRYETLEWLNYVATELHKGFAVFFYPAFTKEMKEQIFTPLMNQKLTYLNQHLENKEFLLANHFTLPDAYLFVMLTWAVMFHFDLANWPNVDSYFQRLKHYPAIEQSLKQENSGQEK